MEKDLYYSKSICLKIQTQHNTWTQMALLFKHFSFEFNHMFLNFVQYFVLKINEL